MKIEYRIKVKGSSIKELTSKGLAVNIADCNDGEYWIVGPDENYLNLAVQHCELIVISPCERI